MFNLRKSCTLDLEAYGKAILVVFVVVLFSVDAYAQERQTDKSKPKATNEIIVTADTPDIEMPGMVVPYPDCKPRFPKITLQRALKIAETYIKTKRITVTDHYLAGVLLVCDETGEAIRWEFSWRSGLKPNINVDVPMNGKSRRVGARIQSIM